MFWKALTIVFIVAGILGGTIYVLHELYYKEKKLDVVEQTAPPEPTPEPTPDPALVAWEALKPLAAKNTPEVRDALTTYLAEHPASPKAAEVETALGRINTALFRDPVSNPSLTVYTVKKGDSLARIASLHKSNAELIHWANQLSSINLQIGQSLIVPGFDASLVVDPARSTVTLLNGGVFFKSYPAVSMQLTGPAAKGGLEAKVADRLARKGETRVAFGTKDYADAERSILIGPGNVVLRPPTPPPAEGADPAATPPATTGIVLAAPDFQEVYVLVKSGSPVTFKPQP